MFEQTVWEIILTLVFIVDKFLLKILGSVVCLLKVNTGKLLIFWQLFMTIVFVFVVSSPLS